MARIRSIKPEIHLDEELWDAEQDSGLPLFRAFTGLWGQADREGRFEWRPRKLKAAILPYWDGDFSRVLDALSTRGFLVRYASQGREIGLVRTFKKHQIVNNREAASDLPPPPDDNCDSQVISACSTRAPRVPDACLTREVHAQAEGKGKEGKGTETRGARSADVRCVFEHWVSVHDKPKAKLTKDRAAKVKARLAEGYTVEQLKQAIDGCKLSRFHMGDNLNGQPYNDLATILRNGQTTDAHIERANGTPVAAIAPKYGCAGAIGDEGAF